ncbi:MAG: DUF4870 domain-containing protein [Dehalococcoidales bacterium]
MELSPEERRKIYEEEKARLEAREQLERERKPAAESTTTLSPNIAGLLCYVGAWITGIIFLILEKKNQWVRFHAVQSLVTFGGLAIISAIIGWLPFIGWLFNVIIGITAFILWIVLMLRAYNGERYHLPIAGDIAESIISRYPGSDYPPPPQSPQPPPAAAEKPSAAPQKQAPVEKPGPAPSPQNLDEKISRRVDDFFERRRAVRITASAFAIAWSIALLIFFNYFYQYVAYYHAVTRGGTVVWERYPFFTSDISRWLPILTATLTVSIIGHIILIIRDRYTLRQVIRLVIDVLGLATIATLLSVFPFDFNALPGANAAANTEIGVKVVLALIAVGFGIGIVVRFIKLVINLITGKADYHRAI